MRNAAGREIPEQIGDYIVKPYQGAHATVPSGEPVHSLRTAAKPVAGGTKLIGTIEEAVRACGLKDGMTISFHHSFREGDEIIGQVLTAIRSLGIRGLCFAPSAVVNIKNPSIVDFVKDGTIDRIEASGIRGELGDAVLAGLMEHPVILRTHGSRPRAIEAGELSVDVAFIGASAADMYGNATGQIGPNACGSLGYSFIDATAAGRVVVITDYLVDYPCCPASISQQYVDYVVKVERIGDPEKIGKGAARLTKNPRDLLIAERAAKVMAASRLFKENFSFQTGAGAISIACTKYLANQMEERGIKASFALGGMTAAIVDMYKKGLVRVLECSQSFDAVAARAIAEEPGIVEIDNALYANPFTKGAMLDKLNFGVLAALEVDTDFNVNILTGSSGEMMGGLGGGPDVAAGADISIVCLPVIRGRTPSVTKRVFTCCTPGETVACVVTEAGIALNPRHARYAELKEDLEKANLKLVTIEELQRLAESLTGIPKPIETTDRIVCIVEYRDGTVIDVIREIKKE
ncbi:MAG: citrate lyase subunit alpha [Lachnospiraceae bacterium]|jgi:citrate lyase subunit alpha/citrate CoA-transferase|nr:citrate lyase subunit alpha [Lachnospiraceae bacterium]